MGGDPGRDKHHGQVQTIGNRVFDTGGVLWWAVRTHGKRRHEFPDLLRRREYSHATVVQLHAPAAAEAFLEEASVRTEEGAHDPHTRL